MASVDFQAWVTPNLDVTLGGKGYSCPPPSVASARIIVAFAAVAEVRLGLTDGPADPALVALCDAQEGVLAVVTLGQDVYDRMVTDGVDKDTIDRVGYYGLHYWAQGKERADWIAQAMWSTPAEEQAEVSPKARRRSKSGPSTASVNQTRTASTPTTGSQAS